MAPTTPVGTVALTVTNGSKVKTYALADLQALKSVTGNGGTKNSGGTVKGPFSYQGVALTDLLNAVGGITSGQNVKLIAADGYTTTLTYDQITNGGFSTYDATGAPVTPTTKPVLVVVYSSNGTLLDSTVGPLEMGLLSSQSLVSDGQLWAKMLIKIDIVSATTTSSTTVVSTTTTLSTTAVTSTTTTTLAIVTTTSTTPVPTTPVILTVVNGTQTTTYSLAQLQQFPARIGKTGQISKTNAVTNAVYQGVDLKDLLNAIGGVTASNSIKITAADNYSKTFTYAQIMNGTGIIVTDSTGNAVTPTNPPVAFLAYQKDGAALDSTTGPLQLGFFISGDQYTQSSAWVKMVVKIEIIAAQ